MSYVNLTSFGEVGQEELLSLARYAENAERYEDMTQFMAKLCKTVCSTRDLDMEERNLLSIAYKNAVGSRRQSWRTLNLDEYKDNATVAEYRKCIETELAAFCQEIIDLISGFLVTAASNAKNLEAQVFYLKMAGDYFRYFAEFAPDGGHAASALKNYQEAYDLATNGSSYGEALHETSAIRLGLALNFSVCYYEILKEPEKACKMAKKAFDDAVTKLEGLPENEYKDSTLIMQLLRDNLTLWTQQDDGFEQEQ